MIFFVLLFESASWLFDCFLVSCSSLPHASRHVMVTADERHFQLCVLLSLLVIVKQLAVSTYFHFCSSNLLLPKKRVSLFPPLISVQIINIMKPSPAKFKTIEVTKKPAGYDQESISAPARVEQTTGGRGSSVSPGDDLGNYSSRQKLLLEGYKISRIVRILTVGEIIFIVLFGVLVPAFLCVLPFPVAGYFGCKKWSFCLLQVFTIYTFLECLLGITSLFFFYKEPIFFSIRCIDIVFNMVTFYYAKQLSAFAHNLGPDDINFLQNDPTIKAIEQGLF